MSNDSKRRKPTGQTGPISIGPNGVSRHFIQFPQSKADIELIIAKVFCAGKAGMRQQIKRYGEFTDLQAQPENSLDFRVETSLGHRWLELAEFAPLNEFGGQYENVSTTWCADQMVRLFMDLVRKKNEKNYGAGVILVIYKTHETLLIPPPVLRSLRVQLERLQLTLESIYFLSPHDLEQASVWEVWPGDPNDDGPTFQGGTVQIGFGDLIQ